LDRDGVVLEPVIVDGNPMSIRRVEEITFVDGLEELIFWANQSGLEIFVVTNQPDVNRGFITADEVARVHEKITSQHPSIRKIYFCPHDDRAHCDCRKPKPGLLHLAAEDYNINLEESILVGDRWRDIDAGNNAGCFTIFIDRNYNEDLVSKPGAVANSLFMATTIIKERFSKEMKNG